MKSYIRTALLGAAGLVVASLPAGASSSTGQDTSLSTSTTKQIQLAQRAENPGGAGYRNENPGGAGYKKKGKKKKKMH